MQAHAALLLPPKHLASCVAVGIYRDTRGADLNDKDRFNYFPASPLVGLTHIVSGELRLVREAGSLEAARQAEPMPRQGFMPAQTKPITSWSSGPVAAVTVGFYPDAWRKLQVGGDERSVPEALATALAAFSYNPDGETGWAAFCEMLTGHWSIARKQAGLPDWAGSDRLSDYARQMLVRAANAGPGRSLRTLERRLKQWTGHTGQSLAFYAAIEDLHQRHVNAPDTPPAILAHDAGFADQSHMGRAVRRATGFSPTRLNGLIEKEEAFWCYRLMGERF